MRVSLIIISLYLLFCALLFGTFVIAAAKKSNVRISRAVYSIAITAESGKSFKDKKSIDEYLAESRTDRIFN